MVGIEQVEDGKGLRAREVGGVQDGLERGVGDERAGDGHAGYVVVWLWC